eukprot:SM000077S21533  [mRNA]  locus=s77:73344:77971:+ [translate_table: standard]
MAMEPAGLANESARRRVQVLSSHIRPPPSETWQGGESRGVVSAEEGEEGGRAGASVLCREPCAAGPSTPQPVPVRASSLRAVSGGALAEYLAGDYAAAKQAVFDFFARHPELQTPLEISKDAHRELCYAQLLGLVRDGGVLWGGSVLNLGTQKHYEKYFSDIESVALPGCFAMTELHHGALCSRPACAPSPLLTPLPPPSIASLLRPLTSFGAPGSNVQGIQTTATFDLRAGEFVVDTPNEGATKWWIGNAASHGRAATVFARLLLPSPASHLDQDYGVHAFVVPLRSADGRPLPGVEIRDCGLKVGLNGVDNGALRFSGVRIPRDNLLNRFGDVSSEGKYTSSLSSASKRFAATLGELVGGRVGLAYGSVAVLKVAATIAVRYSLVRQQFGPPDEPEIAILDYQSQQQKLMPMLAHTYAFHFAADYLVKQYVAMKKTKDEELVMDVHALSAGLKAYITSYTQRCLSVCRESCGGHGYAAVNRFGILRNDHDIFQTFEGDNTVLLQQLSADLLKRYREKFSVGPLSVTWNYLRAGMGTYLSQTNPVTTHREGYAHLRDPQFQLDAFQYRTAKLLHTAALRLRKHSKKLGSFGAWNRCLNHLLTLAESHVESVILARFIDAVNSCNDPGAKAALKLLCDLFALERIWKDIGTYRNEDYVAPNKAKAIHRLVERLCFEARGIARELVDGFGIPDHLVRAPIGLKSGQYVEYSHHVGW